MDRLSPVPESPARPRGHGGSEVVPSSPGSGSCPLPPGDDDLWPRQPGNDLCPWSPTLEDDLCPCSPQQLHDLCPCSPTLDLCPHSGCLDGPCPDLPPDPLPSGLTCEPAQPAEAQSDSMTPDACSLAATTTAHSPPTACSPATFPPSACSPPITAANSPPIACSPVTGANSPPSVSEPPSACPSPAAPPSACSPLSTGSSPSACDSPPACSSPLSDCSPPSAGEPWTLGDPWSACSPPPGEGSPPAVRTPPRCGPGPYPSHNSCKTLKCPWCNWRYKYRRTLEAHVRDKHGGGAQARCPHCRGGAPHPRLARGLAHPCGYRPFRCRPCDYATTTKGNLSIHRQSEQHQARLRALTPTLGANTVTARLRALTPTLGANTPLPITARAPALISSPPLYPQTRTEGGHLTGSQVACGDGGPAGQRSSTEGDEVAGGEEGTDGQTTARNLRAEVSGGLRCPLCADTLSDPGSLRSHLTLGHSVVSGCVARLLPTAAVVKCSLGSETPPVCTEPGLESRPPSQHSQGTGRSGVEVFGAWDQVVSLPRDANAEGQCLEQWTTAVVSVGRSPVPSAQALCGGGGPRGEEEEGEEAGLAASLRPGACPVRRAHNCPACRVSVTQRVVPLVHRSSLGPAPDTPASHRPRPSSLLQVQAPDPAQGQAEAVMQAQASVQTQPGAEIQAQVSSPAEDPPEAGIQAQAQNQADIQAQASAQAQPEAEIQAQASDQAPDAGQAPAEALSQLGCLGPEALRGERADPNLSPGAFSPSAPVWDGSPGSGPCREVLPRAGGLKRKLEGERGEEEAGRRGRRDKRARAPSSPQQGGVSRDPSPPGRPEPQAWAQSSALPSCQETARPSSTRPKPVPRPPALPGCREIARPSSTRPDVGPRPQALPGCRETAPPSPGRPDGGGPRRCRTQMSGLQLEVMRACFRQRRAPSVPECQALAAQIGLPRRVVQIWFQNARAKEKRGVLGPGAGPGLGSGAACSLGCRPSPTGLGHVFTGPHISRVKELVLGRLRQGLNAGPAQDTAQDPAPAHHSPRDPPLPLQALPLPGLPPLLLPGPSNTSGPTAPTPGLSSSPLLCVGAPSLVPVQSAIPQLGEGEGESVGRGFLSPLLPYLLPPLLSPQPPLTYPLPLSLQGGEEVPRALGPALLGLLPQAWLQKALLCSSLGLGLGCPEPGPGAQAGSLPGPQPPGGGESSAGPGPEALSAGAGPGLEPGLRAYPAGP